MKKLIKKTLGITLIVAILILNFSNFTVLRINATTIQDVNSDGTQVEEKYQINNFATHYFYHLSYNFGYNRHGSCSYVAIAMLMSYYDTYWNDNFIHEAFEANTETISTVYPLEQHESPGIRSEFEIKSQLQSMSYYQYYIFLRSQADSYLHFHLIDRGITAGYHNTNGEDFGVNETQLYSTLTSYVNSRFALGASVLNLTESTDSLTIEAIVDSIDTGHPALMIGTYGNKTHAMIAYDYSTDESGNIEEIFVHLGEKRDDNNHLTHVELSSTGYTNLKAYALNVTMPHQCTNNYVKCDNEGYLVETFCSCCFPGHPEYANHQHYYQYIPYSARMHKKQCVFCNDHTLRNHVVAAGSLLIAKCLECGATVNLKDNPGQLQGIGGNIHATPNNISSIGCEILTVNGSYRLANGIIVLVEEDISAYMSGELEFP